MVRRLIDVASAPYQAHSFTSRIAAEEIAPHLPSIRRRVFDFIWQNPGVTDKQIRQALSLNANTARPRRIELERKRLIEWTGESKSGAALTWRATGIPYPEHWQEEVTPSKTRSGEVNLRRSLRRVFPLRTNEQQRVLEEVVIRGAARADLSRVAEDLWRTIPPTEFLVAIVKFFIRNDEARRGRMRRMISGPMEASP